MWDNDCPYCRVYDERGVWVRCEPCGMSWEEHRRAAEVREQAREDARQAIMQERMKEQYAATYQQTIHDELDRKTRTEAQR
jgi:hypothetical protein